MLKLFRKQKRDPEPMPTADMRGKTCLITGATDGHGRACAEALARMGAQVVLHGRSPDKLAAVQSKIEAETGSRPDSLLCDLADRRATDRACAEFMASKRPLHLLLNNAGLVRRHREWTRDGLEMTFAVNYLAMFQLTLALLPRLLESGPARIVNVASDAHRIVSLPLGDLEGRSFYNFMIAYSRSKLAILYFTTELARRLENSGVTVNALDPGPVASGIADDEKGAVARLASVLIKRWFPTPARAARTALHLCTSQAIADETGAYYRFMRRQQPRFDSRDAHKGEKLWAISASMTGLDWPS
jgi:retinol dehydrogenase-12